MNERAGAWLDASLRHRLWFAGTDGHDTASLPFGLCRRGDLVVARHLTCGWVGDREVRAFDLDVLVRDQDRTASSSLVDAFVEAIEAAPEDAARAGLVVAERWACAVVRADAECWRLSVAPEGLWSTLADLAIVPDQDLESEAFNRAFEVRADDRAFASAFLDPRMASFLLERAIGCIVETVGNRILVARPAADLSDPEAVLTLAIGVAERVPDAVRSLYPALPAGELTPRCPIGRDGRACAVEPATSGGDRYDPWPDVPRGWA